MAHGQYVGRTYIKHEAEAQKLRMGGGSWTINLNELPDDCLYVKYITERAVYLIDTANARKHGFMRVLGGEPKLVVPITNWEVTEHAAESN